MTAEEILKAIIEMDNSERIKLLNKLYDRYFDNRPPREQIIKEKEEFFWGTDDDLKWETW